MKKHKMLCILCNIGIGILLPCILLGVFWFLTGSFEIEPTAEQMEKARMAAGMLMTLTGLLCVICIVCRMKFRKE